MTDNSNSTRDNSLEISSLRREISSLIRTARNLDSYRAIEDLYVEAKKLEVQYNTLNGIQFSHPDAYSVTPLFEKILSRKSLLP